MAKQLKSKQILAAPSDAVRIVPLHQPGEAIGLAGAARKAPSAQLTYRGGPLLQNGRSSPFSGELPGARPRTRRWLRT